MKKAFIVAAFAVSCFSWSEKVAVAHPQKRTPQVKSVVVKDQVGMTADGPYSDVNTWLSGNLGELGPGQYIWTGDFQRGFYKKVEVKFQLVSADDTFDFKIKQQKRGVVKRNGQIAVIDGKPQSWKDWVQDGGFPFQNATRTVDSKKRLFLWDTTGIGTPLGPGGGGITESDVYDMHFRDKVKWNGPKGEQDIFKAGEADDEKRDPYFGYWMRYISIWTNPAAPPNGTNDRWTEGG